MTSIVDMAKQMNDVERFDCNWKSDSDGWPVAYMEPFRAGEYVRHADYAALQSELAAARRKLEDITAAAHGYAQELEAVKAELAHERGYLDFVRTNRVALIPEYEGQWDAEIYGEDGWPSCVVSGESPRDAIGAAIAIRNQEAEK